MPLVMMTNNTSYSSFSNGGTTGHYGSATRHPRLTPGVATTYAFGFHCAPWHAGSFAQNFGTYSALYAVATSGGGILGDPANQQYSGYLGGVLTSRVPIASAGTNNTGVSRGGWRGYLRHMRVAQLVAHNFGDTFEIEGKAYAGFGSTPGGLWDTAA